MSMACIPCSRIESLEFNPLFYSKIGYRCRYPGMIDVPCRGTVCSGGVW